MGIHGFYSWLVSVEYPGVRLRSLHDKVESLSIDCNGIFHKAAQQVYGYGEGANPKRQQLIAGLTEEQLEAELMQDILQRITEVIMWAKPQQTLQLKIDGVAVPAKISQQRRRRYNAALEKMEASQKLGYKPKVSFDANCITPGTRMMQRLHLYIEAWIAKNRAALPPHVSYSSHMAPGEGEHKIYKAFREGSVPQGEGLHLVYGMDGDLIMLSLLSPQNRIVLVRENFTDLIDIDSLREGLIAELKPGKSFPAKEEEIPSDTPAASAPVQLSKEEQEALLISDFVVLFYFVGNDFLPSMMAFHSTKSALAVLFRLYKALPAPLTNLRGGLEWEQLASFLTALGAEEPALLKVKAGHLYQYPSAVLDEASTKVETARDLNYLSQGSKIENADNRFVVTAFDYEKFRAGWYYNSLAPRTSTGQGLCEQLGISPVDLEDVRDMCYQYLYGLQWVLQYYLGADISRRYLYSYYHCPLLTDIGAAASEYLSSGEVISPEDVQNTEGELPISPIHQMVAVLPPASSALIPAPFDRLILPGGALSYLCPLRYQQDRQALRMAHEQTPILPILDLEAVVEVVDKMMTAKVVKEYAVIPDWESYRDSYRAMPFVQLPGHRPREFRGRGGFRGGRGGSFQGGRDQRLPATAGVASAAPSETPRGEFRGRGRGRGGFRGRGRGRGGLEGRGGFRGRGGAGGGFRRSEWKAAPLM